MQIATQNPLNSAIEGFTNWQQPWTFFEVIRLTPCLSQDELATWQQVWDLACQAEYWQTTDRLYFFMQYCQLQRLGKFSKWFCRQLIKRSQRK